MTDSVLDFFRKNGGNPFVLLIVGLSWLVGRIVPGRLGGILASVVFASLFAYLLILMYHSWLARFWADLLPPAL
jgi:hypothetical protein